MKARQVYRPPQSGSRRYTPPTPSAATAPPPPSAAPHYRSCSCTASRSTSDRPVHVDGRIGVVLVRCRVVIPGHRLELGARRHLERRGEHIVGLPVEIVVRHVEHHLPR